MRVTRATPTSELVKEINRHPGFRATVWGGRGLKRVHIKSFRYVSEDRGTDGSFETSRTIYIEFNRDTAPLLTVKEVDMSKDPEWECRVVSYALSQVGIHVDCKPSPVGTPSHFIWTDSTRAIRPAWMPCDCLN